MTGGAEIDERDSIGAVVNARGTLPPLVFTHTWHTEARHLLALGEALGPDQPVYGIEAPGEYENRPLRRVPEWVDHHLAGLARLPVEPPYFLAGWSFGGIVAMEVARRLQAQGTAVAFVGMIDSVRPKRNPRGLRPYLEHHRAELRELPWARRRRYVVRLALGGAKRDLMRARRMVYRIAARIGVAEPRPLSYGMSPLKLSVWKAYLNYAAEPYTSPVSLYYCDDTRDDKAAGDPALRWSRVLRGGLELSQIPGGHLELFDPPNVESLARCLERSLETARQRHNLRLASPG